MRTAASCSRGSGARSRSQASTRIPLAPGMRVSSRSRKPDLVPPALAQLAPRGAVKANRTAHRLAVATQEAPVGKLDAADEPVGDERPAVAGAHEVAADLEVLAPGKV